eukprot:7340188-Pyramimonas_sp.AAC.1
MPPRAGCWGCLERAGGTTPPGRLPLPPRTSSPCWCWCRLSLFPFRRERDTDTSNRRLPGTYWKLWVGAYETGVSANGDRPGHRILQDPAKDPLWLTQ